MYIQNNSEEIKQDFIRSETGDLVKRMFGIVLLIGLQIAYLACSRRGLTFNTRRL